MLLACRTLRLVHQQVQHQLVQQRVHAVAARARSGGARSVRRGQGRAWARARAFSQPSPHYASRPRKPARRDDAPLRVVRGSLRTSGLHGGWLVETGEGATARVMDAARAAERVRK
jgi:hypothetical protein